MKFNNVVIAAAGSFVPEEIVSSDLIEERLSPIYQKLKLPEGRLELMTGIKERRVWSKGTRPSLLSTNAALNLKEKSGETFEDIDLLIHSAVCRDFLEPSTASVIHHELGLPPSAMIFDLSNACLGMMNSITVAGSMIKSGQIRKALIVSGENGGPLLEDTISSLLKKNQNGELTRKNIKKYIANLTIGSAATAFIIGHKDDYPEAAQVLGGAVATDSSANILCQGDGNSHSLMMETDSEALMKKGVILAKENWLAAKDELGWSNDDVDFVLTHQVGKAHEELTLSTLSLEKKKTFRTYPTFGNTGSSALPLTLVHMIEANEDLLKPQDRVAMMGIGSGLTSIILGLSWGRIR
jgi:3-oxoacyl-[acyl-carrier-protein] synthase III